MRCNACRRPLTNPVSIKHGLGPDCLKRAVAAGNAPLEALEELTVWKKANPKPRRSNKPAQAPQETTTPDLFSQLRETALEDLHKAVAVCETVGLTITIEIK